ncbi:serine hydrolase domain-containing protein [Sphingosinicella sp. LHD-64]|uniref:serine hydrolase domain-containing protein n=1 Tax=Sphingosinicella sp. LHD-64 TaxID=3072139 RepID=UPI00280DE5EB|nr:serine hydrolase domain-containing protein [Sphingosinicella sp. LHD-64]MDQ8757449.1 serine hydrolase domain-containing protein [Sphingosinicella sp. LHD-64]
MAAIDAIARETVQTGQTAGLVVGVSVNGSPVFVRSYGVADIEHNVPVTDRSVFRIGSLTKQFTAAAILLLAEDGRLSLDDPLSTFFPDFPRGSEVTVRELLRHTGGIRSYTEVSDYFPTLGRQNMTTEQMVSYISNLDNLYDFEPGTSYHYSNSGYYLLGAIIEKVSGQSYPAFLKARIFDPLGLRNTAVDDTVEIVADRANGYAPVRDRPGAFTNASYIAMSAAGAAGAMRSTAEDLLTWANALLGGRVLRPESLAAMVEPGRLRSGQLSSTAMAAGPSWQTVFDYGFGLALRRDEAGRQMIGHNGAINGFHTYSQNFPDQHVSIVLLANADGISAFEAGPRVARAFFDNQGR